MAAGGAAFEAADRFWTPLQTVFNMRRARRRLGEVGEPAAGGRAYRHHAEAITFGMKQGLAPDGFLEVISKCAGTTDVENRAPHVVEGDYTRIRR